MRLLLRLPHPRASHRLLRRRPPRADRDSRLRRSARRRNGAKQPARTARHELAHSALDSVYLARVDFSVTVLSDSLGAGRTAPTSSEPLRWEPSTFLIGPIAVEATELAERKGDEISMSGPLRLIHDDLLKSLNIETLCAEIHRLATRAESYRQKFERERARADALETEVRWLQTQVDKTARARSRWWRYYRSSYGGLTLRDKAGAS